MNYLVVSDNHGDRQVLVDLYQTYQGKVDFMFHCGDSELRPQDDLWQHFTVVKGNCDYDVAFEEEQLIDTGQDRVYLTHGHLANVRFGLEQLSFKAQAQAANLVLFGHTHEIGCEMHHGTLFLNPGSIRLPRGPLNFQSYALIESTEDQFKVQYYTRQHQPIDKLTFTFSKN